MSAIIIGICMAIFAGGIAVAFGGVAGDLWDMQQEMTQFDDSQRPGESPNEYMTRMNREVDSRMDAHAATADQAVSSVVTGAVLAFLAWILLSSLLVPILAMPLFVGYRDMSPLAERKSE
jgi:hypothetical protein